MQFFVLLSLLAELFVSTKAAKPRSINVALDTVFEFDKLSDVHFINQIQGILNKVKNKIKGNPKQDDIEYTMRVKQYKFTNFLEDLIETVLTFNDKDLMDIVQIVKNEIQQNKHGALQENIRRFLSNELNLIKVKPVKIIREDLDKLLRKLQNTKKEKNNIFLGFINTLYKRDTQEKLSNFIRKLKIFRQRSRKSGQLQHTVRKAVQLIIIDYFSNLSEDTKIKVETRLKDYLLDEFSTVRNDKNYPLKQKQPHKITIAPELVLQNSEDTNTEETIEIEEKGFKSHRNNYIPYFIQDRSENTDVSTKTLAKNEVVNVKQKKVSDEEELSIENESHVTSEERYTNGIYSTDTTRLITHPKPKRSHNNKNKRRNVTTELSPKTYVTNNFLNVKHKNYNEGEAMSIEKVTKKESDDGNSKERYGKRKYIMAKRTQTTYSKSRRSHTKKSKERSKNANIKYSKGKLTHITLYPGNIKIERRNYRDLKKDKNNKAKNKRTLDDVTLTSISYDAEINVSLKNNKIKFVYDVNKDNVRKHALMKVRAFRQKLMETRTIGDNKDLSENNSENMIIKRNDITTPKPSVAYFGNLFKSKGVPVDESDSRQFDDSDIDHTHKVTEYYKKIDNKIETRNIENINNVTTIITRNNLDEKQRDFRATDANNDFQEKADYRLPKQVAEDTSAKKLDKITKTVHKIKENDFLITSRYRLKPRQDTYIADKNSDSKFKTIEITTDSYDRLAKGLDNEENISNINMKISEISTKNYEELDEYNFVENKPERNITTLEIKTRDYFSNNRGYRRTKEHKIIDKVRLDITTNEINAIKKSTTDMDIKATLTSNMDYNMPPVTLNTRADKIINKVNESIVHKTISDHNLRKITKATKKVVENHKSTHRKIISKQFTEKIQELSTKFTNEGMHKISKHINLGLDKQEKHHTTKTQSEFKSGTQTLNIRKQTNANQNISTKSYNKDIKQINYITNDSRRQLNIHSKSTTAVNKDRELDANFKENNKISTTAVDRISLDNKVTKNKDNKQNSIKLKTTPKIVFKDELLDAEFVEEIKNSQKNPVPIDIQKYIKNPAVPVDLGDEKKKKEIEQKMKEELSNLFTSPSTKATTTAAYTDIFEAMDDEFGLGPLK